MPELIADNISIIQSNELEVTARIDAEYYQPKYLELEKKILSSSTFRLWKDIDGEFITGPFGSSFKVENYVKDIQKYHYRYIRGKDVKEFFLLDNDNVYITYEDFKKLNKYSLFEGDILISVVGTLGNASIVDKKDIPAIYSCKSTAFRSKNINTLFLICYLNCCFGKQLLQRKVRGAIQTGLNIDDLKSLIIYFPDIKIQNTIAQLIINAKESLEKSKYLYSQAETFLLENLGIENLDLSNELCYEVNSFDTISANRIDAEYYKPKYEMIIEAIKKNKFGCCRLTDRIINITDKHDPQNEPQKIFKYIELSNINSSIGIVDDFSEIEGKELPSRARMIVKEGDIIMSSVEGSIDRIALIDNYYDSCLASTGFFVLRCKENTFPEYVLILCKSILVQKQLERLSSGTILTAVSKNLIQSVIIPDVPIVIQKEIAVLIRQSHSACRQARELIKEAKCKVEEMIENN